MLAVICRYWLSLSNHGCQLFYVNTVCIYVIMTVIISQYSRVWAVLCEYYVNKYDCQLSCINTDCLSNHDCQLSWVDTVRFQISMTATVSHSNHYYQLSYVNTKCLNIHECQLSCANIDCQLFYVSQQSWLSLSLSNHHCQLFWVNTNCL